ncbi:TIGR02266 family protein [Myxococcus sp. K15C18031901]|uniref:TIGR02266 family protein n=1 Tax=Myxococcus dinghuensis TaxID=2906761 RepID=UPI0020A6FC4A|nr:TIGR02266 family protein [Myxococcus dinghuensis]MCP3103147.1 TIGR02266 family protein [Myxococcus dinghuensis]
MPVFGLAALWNGNASPERAAAVVEGLGDMLPTAQSLQLVVGAREDQAGVEVKVEAPGYPRASVDKLADEVKRSGGSFVELWRLPKAERDAFRTTTFAGGRPFGGEDRAGAARALAQHLTALATRSTAPTPVLPTPPPPVTAPEQDPRRVPQAPPGSPQRRGRRFAVRLELEFRTELEFVREHALNISNGGLFVRTAHRPLPDSVVTVDVKLPNGEHLQGDAVVVHVLDDPYSGGVGLAFLSDDATFARTLDGYLASLAGGTG